jgi:RNA polymerase sigma-70 factor (ECF subfamily)
MIEGKRVVAGEAILSGVTTTDRGNAEHSRIGQSKAERQEAILEAMVREHSRLVYHIAYAVLHSHHDAEDATQETFVRVLRHSSKLEDIEEPKAWLARIAWRVAVDRSRQVGLKREIPLDDPERPVAEPTSSAAGADQKLQGAQIGAHLERLIEALPEKLRNPLLLSAIEEMSPREVAGMLGINEAAVRSRIFRARQILKEKLAAFEASDRRG